MKFAPRSFWAYPCGPGYPFIRLQALGARADIHCYPLRGKEGERGRSLMFSGKRGRLSGPGREDGFYSIVIFKYWK